MAQVIEMGKIPAIFVSTVPAELIVTTGEPDIEPNEDTGLFYVANTESDVLVDSAAQFYFLTSGRWFKASTLKGPWAFVPGTDLPADFKKIPADHPKGAVLASIPQTEQARESIIANSIPQTATIKKSEAKFKPSFDGTPQFASIEGTNLKYAKNSPVPVIDVPGNTYYALNDGIWFKASDVNDTWVVADSVPNDIYTIPPTSPIYYSTYVQEYGSTPDEAYFGYTPGYYGTVVSDGVVVYGTGYTYHPWVGSDWYGAPLTYGCGAEFGYHPAYGWTFGFDESRPLASPWYGPMAFGWNGSSVSRYHWNGYGDWGGASAANVYHRWGSAVAGGTRVAWANPWTGNVGVARRGAAYNPATGRYTAGRSAAVYNTRTGGVHTAHQRTSGNVNIGSDVSGRVAAGAYDSRGNNFYAYSKGNVYRRDSAGNFQQFERSGWANTAADRDLVAEQNVRSQAAARQNINAGYRAAGPAYGGAGRGGFGGGGRGRR
jgi:hypothetical protein